MVSIFRRLGRAAGAGWRVLLVPQHVDRRPIDSTRGRRAAFPSHFAPARHRPALPAGCRICVADRPTTALSAAISLRNYVIGARATATLRTSEACY